MSNINPRPKFVRLGGPATAAPASFPYAHRNLAEVDAAVERVHAQHRNPIRDAKGRCRFCKGKSAEWKVGTCPECGGHGR